MWWTLARPSPFRTRGILDEISPQQAAQIAVWRPLGAEMVQPVFCESPGTELSRPRLRPRLDTALLSVVPSTSTSITPTQKIPPTAAQERSRRKPANRNDVLSPPAGWLEA